MKTLYLDIFSGISGDMFIGALLDLGLPLEWLESELKKLPVTGYHLHAVRGEKSKIAGTKFDVHLEADHQHPSAEVGEHVHEHVHTSQPHSHEDQPAHDHEHGHEHGSEHSHRHGHRHNHGHNHNHGHSHGRNYAEIEHAIAASALSDWVKAKATAVFKRIAVAEGRIHGLPPEKVHFHEVGAVDSIVDIVGACIGLEWLGKPRVLAARPVDGTGWVDCAHGRFPIPAPATLEILAAARVAISQTDEPHEMITPTGAALLAELVESFGAMEGVVPERIGYGLGTRDHRTRPNVLRAVLGESAGRGAHDWETDFVEVLETNLDDVGGEILGDFVERAFSRGALDVYHTPVQMKKNRPGVLLTVLCPEANADDLMRLMLSETTAFGVRRTRAERRKLQRRVVTVRTAYGPVEVKLGLLDGATVQAAPEYESCKAAARTANVSLKTVYHAALLAAQSS